MAGKDDYLVRLSDKTVLLVTPEMAKLLPPKQPWWRRLLARLAFWKKK